ncbi:MAG TPA: LLM class flavin-dependent oxidoreductase [Acidimicrobiia bacterium]|nr:LLM class flavin-dependent oxidoreductase [Acidimicrobiia bacterium]
MHAGLYLPNQGPFADPRRLAGLAAEAEAAGWEGFFFWDEMLPIFDPGHDVADALIGLSAVAMATERLRIGAMVSPVSRLRPETFAHQTATLDRLSGGRLIVGVGLGNPSDQFSAFGHPADIKERAAMVDEFLDLLTRLWSGSTVDFHGTYYTAAGVKMTAPLQSPRIPIWIGADTRNRAPRRRAARWDGFIPASHHWPDEVIPLEDYEAAIADIRALRPATDPFDVIVIGDRTGTQPTADALKSYEAAGVTWLLVQALTPEDAEERIRRGPPF